MTVVESLLRCLVDGSLAATAAVLMVLALRRPLQRAFGARVAYSAWALVPLALFAASLPRPQAGQVLAPQCWPCTRACSSSPAPVERRRAWQLPAWTGRCSWPSRGFSGRCWQRCASCISSVASSRRWDGWNPMPTAAGAANAWAVRPSSAACARASCCRWISKPATHRRGRAGDPHERAHLARGDSRAIWRRSRCLPAVVQPLLHSPSAASARPKLACDATCSLAIPTPAGATARDVERAAGRPWTAGRLHWQSSHPESES